MMKLTHRTLPFLLAVLLLVWGSAALVSRQGKSVLNDYAAEQLAAANTMLRCMEAVRGYKEQLGIPLDPEDFHRTGMLGEDFNFITTTLGAPEAKRTSAGSDMAALSVRLLHEAGVKAGDTVGIGSSGSFPALAIAMLAACDCLGARAVIISSVGASTHGANNPGLSWPEMLHRLVSDGLLPTDSAAVTWGGGDDNSGGMDFEMTAAIAERLIAAGLAPVAQTSFSDDIAWRMALYEREGPISCFVGIGGNVTTPGRSDEAFSLGQGLLRPNCALRVSEDSGLLVRYQAKGIPAIHLLNLKKLTAEYGLPYDPTVQPEPGKSAVYFRTVYPKVPIAAAFAATLLLLFICHRREE